MMENIDHLHTKIEEIDEFLIEKEQEREEELFQQQLREKEQQIERIRADNEELRRLQTQGKREGQEERGNPHDILQNITPNALYFFCIMLMAIVAIA
jgi:riboflavin synthase